MARRVTFKGRSAAPRRARKSLGKRKRSAGNMASNKRSLVRIGAPSTASSLSRSPMPIKSNKSFRYVSDVVTLNPGVGGTAADHVFRANSLFDPDYTGVGHQPLGFDELISFYNHATVIGVKLTAYFRNTDSTYPQFVAVQPKASATSVTNIQEVMEQGNCQFSYLSPAGVSGDRTTITYPLSIGKFFGRRGMLTENDFRCSSTANPTEQVYLHVMAADNSGTDTASVEVTVVLDYIAILSEPKPVVQS